MELKAYRLNPHACQLVPAEKTLNGEANAAGVKWCHPFSTANRLGWWMLPPCDFDLEFDGKEFQQTMLSDYPETEAQWVRTIITPQDEVNPDAWCPLDGGRTKFSLGKVEPGVAQVWTGLIFKTPPGWSLQIRSPINTHPQPYRIMEGILETDWMQYDIWLNVVFDRPGKAEFRRDGWPPIAQIIPVQRQTYSPWTISVQDANRDDPESNQALDFWMQYNEQKFGKGGQQYLAEGVTKDSTTFFRNRKRILDDNGLPKPQELAPKCPFMARQALPPTGKKIVLYKRKNPGLKRPGQGAGENHQ